MPNTPNEWSMFLKFHLTHLHGVLHEEMILLVQSNTFQSTESFWNVVFQKIFPSYMAREAFDKALSAYMVWNEAQGIERWEANVQAMAQFLASMTGKTGTERRRDIAEQIFRQFQRVVDNSQEQQSAQLSRDFSDYTGDIEKALSRGQPITAEMYEFANQCFYAFLHKWLNRHTYELTFGYPRAGSSTRATGPGQLNHISATQSTIYVTEHNAPKAESPPPSYSQVVTEGGRGAPAPSLRQMRPLQQKEHIVLDKVGPTGKLRTWGWQQTTRPADKSARVPCNAPAPADCTNPKIKYYGDWLEEQGLCTYCCTAGHTKDRCEVYAKACAYWQENPRPSAQ